MGLLASLSMRPTLLPDGTHICRRSCRRRRGVVVETFRAPAHEPAANYASLSLGKAALRNLTYSLAQELGGYGIHVATVTVYGFVQSGTHYDPARIAEAYLRLHRQAPGHFQTELVFK